VPAPDFLFALVLSDDSHVDSLLAEVMTTVCGHVGLAADASRELREAVRRAVGDGGGPGQPPCRVAFRAGNGELQVTVARDGAAEWRDARPLP
jgi:hypothetical protein